MFYGDFVFKFFSLDSILFALFDILTLFQGRLDNHLENQKFNYFRDYMSVDKVIHEFMNHSSLKLDRPDLEEIRNLKIRYDLEKIVIYDPLPERLKNHIRDYFYNHPQRVISLQFEENKFHVAA
ncbi:hypothetical protein LEP1GSC008_2216 [Leptospira kirschneri serovar Bulgarica str. Nikolaevo]|uniref:Uncharacterized protein n=1 Tax=Leptospira kirschneri serovar Bulgarica str. Nikolaevo TaxID=1240687 RepID=M6FCZ4_9LEPT|nr:hypothetical protein LEP1GSC008_2216 [Leptospira kirschneri serovar Bulgarica str. Nikolaevo]